MNFMWKTVKGLFASVLITGLCFASAVFIVLLYANVTGTNKLFSDDVNQVVYADELDPIIIEEDGTADVADDEDLEAEREEEVPLHPVERKDRVRMEAPLVLQYPELPRGCEVTTLTMLLLVAGHDVDKVQLAGEMMRDDTPIQYAKGGGIAHWGHPNIGFVGDITLDSPGFGAYHKPMYELLLQYEPDAVDLTGESFDTIEAYLSAGVPVMAWTTTNNRAPEEWEWVEWDSPGGQVRTTFKEHAVLLVGYDETSVYFNDPLKHDKYIQVEKQQFIESWEALDQMALSLSAAN